MASVSVAAAARGRVLDGSGLPAAALVLFPRPARAWLAAARLAAPSRGSRGGPSRAEFGDLAQQRDRAWDPRGKRSSSHAFPG